MRRLKMAAVTLGALCACVAAARAASAQTQTTQTQTTTTGTVIEQPVTPATADTAPPPVTTAPASVLKVTPALADYGVVRKGTRAVRQFEATNSGAAPLTIDVARSACHCLIYDYNGKTAIAPGAKETITVTVDGAKAKPGPLEEQVAIKDKKSSSVLGTIRVREVVK